MQTDVTLLRHGGPVDGAVRGIHARVRWLLRGTLEIAYALVGEIAELRIPSPGPTRAGNNLWQHTCFELFIACPGMPAYHELNFSPSGGWAVYAFSNYRQAIAVVGVEAPRISVRRAGERLELDATIQLPTTLRACERLALGITAVVEAADGTLSYWALSHPGAKPDFHRPESFTLEIDAVRH